MSARPIGEIILPILEQAIQMMSLQRVLGVIDDPSVRKIVIMAWRQDRVISDVQAELLIEHNHLEAA